MLRGGLNAGTHECNISTLKTDAMRLTFIAVATHAHVTRVVVLANCPRAGREQPAKSKGYPFHPSAITHRRMDRANWHLPCFNIGGTLWDSWSQLLTGTYRPKAETILTN